MQYLFKLGPYLHHKPKQDLKFLKKLIFFLFHAFNVRNKQKLRQKSSEVPENSYSKVIQMS